MKKLMTMIAAVATAFGLYAAEGDIDSFDAATGSLTDGQWSYTNAVITSENLPPLAEVSLTGYPQKLVLATGTKTLSRNYPGAPVSITGDALYLDTYINFDAPFEEMPTIDASAKIAAFVLDNSELVAEMREQGKTVADRVVSTNLYAIGGYWDATANAGEGAFVPAAFMFDTAAAYLDNKEERRLTVKAYKNVLADDTRMGFRFFLDGVDNHTTPAMKVLYVFPIVDGAIDFTSPIVASDPTTPYLGCEATKIAAEVRGRVKSTDRSLLISLAGMSSLNALDFAGKGAIGSLLLTANAPSFIEDDAYTMEVKTEGVASVSVTGAKYDNGVITFAAGTDSIGVTATYEDGCTIVKWTYQEGDVTPDPVTAERTISPVKGATLNIRAVASAATVKVDGVTKQVETLADAVKAITESESGSGSIVLDNNAALGSTALTFEAAKTYVLDLAGKNITGSGAPRDMVVISNRGNLTITNSTDQIGAIIPSKVATVDAVSNKGDATLVIAGGKFDGKISDANNPSTITTVGGLFKKEVFEAAAAIPGVPKEGYDVVEGPTGYWTVVPVTGYSVKVDPAIQNGTVTVDKETAAAGETVTVTATAGPDYKLSEITTNGSAIVGNTFVMPAANVTVSATFIAKDCVAQIVGGQSFETLAEAVAEVADGQTIKLLKNYSAVANEALLINAHNVTLDLGGFSLTNVNVAAFKFGVAAGNTVTVTNGTVTMPSGSYGFHVGTNAVANIFCKMEKLSASNPVIDVYGGTLNCNAATELCSKSDVIRTKDKNLTSTVNISGGKYTTTCGQDIGIIHHYKDGHVLNLSITGGDFDAQSLIDAYKEKDTDPTGPSLIFTKFNASSTARFSDATLAAVKDHSIITEADLIADGCKVVADTEKTGWYKVAAIEYATYKVTTDEGVESYVVSNATAEVAAGAKFDIDETVTLTVYPTLKADYEFVTAECVLTDTLTEAKEYELKVVTKAAAPVIPPVAPGGAPVEVKAEDADKVVIKATAPAGSGITDEAYTAYFSKSVVDIGEGKVRVSAVLDETKIEFAGSVENLGEEVSKIAAGAESATIAAKPGLYYYVEEANDVTKIAEPERDRVMATGATVTIPTTKFEGSGFYRLKCSTTQRGTVTGN